MGAINYFGPKHSGSLAVALALPTLLVVIVLIGISAPHLTTHFLEPRQESLATLWVQFVGVILALSGAESIANVTGVMKLDPGSTMDHPSVARESIKAIIPVAIEVVVGTALLGWAMLSLPSVLGKTLHLSDPSSIASVLQLRSEDMLRFIGEQFATATFSPAIGNFFGWIVGIVFFLLLLSAANTAIVAMIGLLYMMSRDREMPREFRRLNRHGVPIYPLLIALGLPTVVLLFAGNFTALAGLYAIGVVGKIMVAARGITPVLGFALDEAQLRKATLCVVYVKEVAVYYSGGPASLGRAKWQDDPEANAIMSLMMKLGTERNVCVIPVYAVSQDAAATIVDLSATLGVDYLVIGSTQRTALTNLLRGSVVTNIAQHLPESIQLLIFG